ncbi:MAG: chromate transporter [Clostridia bacterium]|nr:chromate transporter [Clostridia bacterium]
MIFLELFITFFKIGLFTFGGGAAMIPLIQQECISKMWLTESELLSFIAISESTPGPIAINMATFVGSSQGELFGGPLWAAVGSICATLGVVMPSFIIILIIAKMFTKFAEYKIVRTILTTIRPIVVGMIIAAGAFLMFNAIGFSNIKSFNINWISIILTVLVVVVMFLYKKIFKKSIPVIQLILCSAVLGIGSYIVEKIF